MYPFQKGTVQKIVIPSGAGCINFNWPLIFKVAITAQDSLQTQTATVFVVFSSDVCTFILKDVPVPVPNQNEVSLAGVGTRYNLTFYQENGNEKHILYQDILVVT